MEINSNANIAIPDLNPADFDLLSDSESYMRELSQLPLNHVEWLSPSQSVDCSTKKTGRSSAVMDGGILATDK